VVLGRLDLVGKPIGALLLTENATVTICHFRTVALPSVCRRAGCSHRRGRAAGMVKGGWIKPEAMVIDVGINRGESGLIGDVECSSASGVAGLITPVPSGVGPMTIAMLLRNTLEATRAQQAPLTATQAT
jgi:methylenetetrahydrofolate dehydrogenase (NADP+) / methenyltetrahydrofolate cyclohydrolase